MKELSKINIYLESFDNNIHLPQAIFKKSSNYIFKIFKTSMMIP